MLRWSLVLVLFLAVIIISVSIYLQPNDLSKCEATPNPAVANCQAADAVVAISGGDTFARVDKAVQLYKNGWARKLIFSGAAADKTGPSNAESMTAYAEKLGVPKEDIILEEHAENTTQNAEKTSKIFDQLEVKKAILVTSGYHQRRANLEFEQKAPNVQVINAPVSTDKHWGKFWWLSPYNWWLAMSEGAKIFFIYTTGGLGR